MLGADDLARNSRIVGRLLIGCRRYVTLKFLGSGGGGLREVAINFSTRRSRILCFLIMRCGRFRVFLCGFRVSNNALLMFVKYSQHFSSTIFQFEYFSLYITLRLLLYRVVNLFSNRSINVIFISFSFFLFEY